MRYYHLIPRPRAGENIMHKVEELSMSRVKLQRAFYCRNTLLVAQELLGKYLVHHLPGGGLVCGRIVETEAYAGISDPGSHTYQDRRTNRNEIWYGEGGFAYVYQIYGSYFCLGIITEPRSTPGAVLIRALEPIDGIDLLIPRESEKGKHEDLCSGPSKLCIAMQIGKYCNGIDLCGDELYLEDASDRISIEDMVFTPRVNIDYAGAGALSHWRYYLRASSAVSKKWHEPLRSWRKGYPSQTSPKALDLFTDLAQREEHMIMSEDTRHQVMALPKVELHLHLEGCVTPTTLRLLSQKNRKFLPDHLFTRDTHYFATFDEFVYTYHRICQAIDNEQDFALVIADVADYLRRNTIIHAEVSWTPFLYLNRGLRFEAVMDVMTEALAAHGIADRVQFLIDIQRDHGVEAGTWVYQQVFASRTKFPIAGVGLTGQEEGFAPSDYQALYRQAEAQGLGTTAHAGEYGTPEDIWQCIHALGVKRIGHGIRAVTDRHLLQFLAERHIHLEICPTSNVRLERAASYSGHPLRLLWQAGVNLGLNSDDPGIFASDLSEV